MICSKNKGILFIIISAVCFSTMSLLVKLSGDLPPIEKGFFRNFIALLVSVVFLIRSRKGLDVQVGNWKFLLGRAFCGTMALICNFYAISNLNLSDANILNKMSPFFAIVFSVFFLREKISKWQMLFVVGAFFGGIFIIKPSVAMWTFGPAMIGLTGGIFAGLAYVFVRVLGVRKQNQISIVFTFSLISTLVTLPIMIFRFEPMSMLQLMCLIMAGVAAAGGQFAITTAYSYAPAKEISVYEYTQIIFSTIFGYLFFFQLPDVLSILGYIVICVMAILMFLYNNNRLKSQREGR